MSGRSNGVSPIDTISRCWCSPPARWPAAPWRGWSPKARATPTPGRPRSKAFSSTSMLRASRESSSIPSRVAWSKVPRTWRWPWWRSSLPGWMRAPPPAVWPVVWPYPPYTSAAPPSSAKLTCASARPRSPARTGSPGAARFASPSRSPTSASKPEYSPGKSGSWIGLKAGSQPCKSKSAAASLPTWASLISSPPPWIRTTRASVRPAWSSCTKPIPALSTAACPRASWCTSCLPPAIPSSASWCPRVTVGGMTAAKLLSAIEPIIRYQRGRFRGGEGTAPGSPRYEFGLQLKEDTLHRLIDIWATGEASASLGFAAARLFDELDPLERLKNDKFAAEGVAGGTSTLRAMRKLQKQGLEHVGQASGLSSQTLDPMIRFALLDSVANVLCPACKLWNTGHGANMMREAVSLMGGYGITEDCPGFLGHKWMDAQLEATYEGPESVQRRQLTLTMTDELFLAQYRNWIGE